MTDTVFISSSNALGSFWTSKRYFDYLIDETNLPLLRGREFGQAVLICPSLWEGRRAIRKNEEAFISHVRQLIDILHEVKIERLTYVTSIDTQPETGNEDSPLVHEFEDAFLSAAGETCKRATLLSAQHEAEIVVICHNGQEGDGSNPGEWRLMPRVWGKGISTP